MTSQILDNDIRMYISVFSLNDVIELGKSNIGVLLEYLSYKKSNLHKIL